MTAAERENAILVNVCVITVTTVKTVRKSSHAHLDPMGWRVLARALVTMDNAIVKKGASGLLVPCSHNAQGMVPVLAMVFASKGTVSVIPDSLVQIVVSSTPVRMVVMGRVYAFMASVIACPAIGAKNVTKVLVPVFWLGPFLWPIQPPKKDQYAP